ncbi:MAG: MFS transporter [bacterium]
MASGLPLTTEQQAAAIRIIWAARLVVLFPMISVGIWFVYIPWKVAVLNLTPLDFSKVLLCFAISSITATQLGGRRLIPRFGAGPLMIAAMCCFSPCLALAVLAPTYLLMLLAVIPCGFFFGLVAPSATAETFRMEKLTGRFLMPMHSAFFSIGSLVGSVVGGTLLQLEVPAHWVFPIMAGNGMFVSLLLWKICLQGERPARTQAPPLRWPDRRVLGFGILGALSLSTIGVVLDWSALWLTRDMLVPMAYGGAIIFAFSLGEIAARLRGESLIQRFGEMRIGSHAMILGGAVLLPAVLSQNPVLIVLVFLFFGFVSANFFPTVMRNAAEIDPENAGVNIADVNTLSMAGLLFGPPLVGYIAEHYSITHTMALLAVIWGCNGVGMYFLLRAKQQRTQHISIA